MSGSGSQFTAAQIAAALGRTPQAVRKALRSIAPAGRTIVNGKEAATWPVDALPEGLRNNLAETARKKQCRTVDALLSAPPVLWRSALPLDEIAQPDIDAALKLREALRPWLIQQHDRDLTSAEMETLGVNDYARVFGRRITGRYWRELFMRTLRRDGGAENWNRLEIYLSEQVTGKKTARAGACSSREFADVDSFIAACSEPSNPTETERRAIWTLALERFAAMTRAGTSSKKAARSVRSYLFQKASFLAPSRDALLKAFDRKRAALEHTGGDPRALRDGREENGSRFEFPEADRDLLIHRAVFQYRGDVAPAWRELLQQGFSDAVRSRYAGKAIAKSHVPSSIMDSVAPEVEILTVMHQGKRAFDSIKGYVTRNYDGIASLKAMTADDFTMPVYFYVPDGNGWFTLTRGQILIFSDFRTLRILGWSMQPDRNYSSLTIRSLCTHVFAEHGLPAVLQFERGIWESSTLLKGRDPAPFAFTEVVQGLREFGIRFVHSIRPRSKTIERIGGLLQDRMEAEPGYCGREERKDAPESLRKQMAEVAARKMHPSHYFLSYEQWCERFGKIVDQYNATPQQGKILNGLSPDQALAKFADADDPPTLLAGAVRYLLAHDKRIKLVTMNGITITIGKKSFNYRGREIAHLIGQEVIAWFDPENPETLTVTDMKRRNPICVSRSNEVDALECLTNPEFGNLARELARVEDQASYMKARFHAVKTKFPMPARIILAAANIHQVGEQIEAQKLQAKQQRSERSTIGTRNREKARRLSIPSVLVGDDAETRQALDLIESAQKEHDRANDATRKTES